MKLIKGKNDLETVEPELASEWHPDKNGELTPEMVTKGSHKIVWWKCKNGHEWQAVIKNRNYSGCPYCSGKRVLKGVNDLATLNPELASEWHPTKNGDLGPEIVSKSSNKKVWWRCKKGHEWQASINNRNKGSGCPICKQESQTSFAEQAVFYYLKKYFPDAINRDVSFEKELDIYIPSLKIAIEYDGSFFHKNVVKDKLKNNWCKKHEIRLIRIREEDCPVLDEKDIILRKGDNARSLDAALIELLCLLDVSDCSVNVVRDRNEILNNYITCFKESSLAEGYPKLVSEWHPTKNGNLLPEMFLMHSDYKVWWKCKEGHEWQATINSRSEGHGCPYCSGRKAIKYETDFKTINPLLSSEWHPFKNGNLTPDLLKAGCRKKVWWLGKCGHEWQATINSRQQGHGCPYCSGIKILKGFNDLATTNPCLAAEWHHTKNDGLTPYMVSKGSNKKVWWLGSCGHEWQDTIGHRQSGRACPYCSGRRVLEGNNDLATINPELALEWHPVKNHDLQPNMVTYGSSKKIWWKCKNGHEWQTTLYNRSIGHGCPYCSGRKVIPGVNDLATTNQNLTIEWHPEKNGNLMPNMVSAYSNKKVWWHGSCGHEWQARIADRNRGSACPFCSGRRILKGVNDLASQEPQLASEWHPNKNGELTPEMVIKGSHKMAWWICKNGHEWQTAIVNRSINKNGCPYCSNQRILKGFNDLATVNPELASEWHPTKNINITPDMVMPGSDKKVWWLGECGHEWQAKVYNRNHGHGCPYCAKKRVFGKKNN